MKDEIPNAISREITRQGEAAELALARRQALFAPGLPAVIEEGRKALLVEVVETLKEKAPKDWIDRLTDTAPSISVGSDGKIVARFYTYDSSKEAYYASLKWCGDDELCFCSPESKVKVAYGDHLVMQIKRVLGQVTVLWEVNLTLPDAVKERLRKKGHIQTSHSRSDAIVCKVPNDEDIPF